MITKSATRNIESNFAGETRQFGMKLNGKAFRILFDGIYSNKIHTPIREYMTNAFDAHVQAGCPERPFDVDVPTMLNPTLRIRDYGLGMDHATVMELYTNMFDSTKGETNDEVGAFGLGSKSAFAYTDTFNVTSYHNGTKRAYLAVIGADDIPTITEIPELGGPTDEPSGFEVSIPIQVNDITSFTEAVIAISVGFDVRPNFNIDVPEIDFMVKGNGWRMFRNTNTPLREKLYVRQGCVLYPVSAYDAGQATGLGRLNHGTSVIVDVPIGSCEVAVSREALAYDARTRANVVAAFEGVMDKLKAELQRRIDDAPTMLMAIRARNDAEGTLYGSTKDMLWRGKIIPVMLAPKVTVHEIKGRGDTSPVQNNKLQPGKTHTFIVDRGEKVVRRKMRLNQYRGSAYVVHNPTNRDLKRLMDVFGGRIVSIGNLPDVTPNRSSGLGGGVKPTGVYNLDKIRYTAGDVPKFDYWLPLTAGNSINEHFALFGNLRPENAWNHMRPLAQALGVTGTTVFLTPKARKDNEVDDSTRLDLVLQKKLKENVDTIHDLVYNQVMKSSAINNQVSFLFDELDIYRPTTDRLRAFAGTMSTYLLTRFGYGATIESATEEANAKVVKLRGTYPILFGEWDETSMRNYINTQRKDKA